MWGLSCCGGAVASFIQDVPMTLGYLLLSLFSVPGGAPCPAATYTNCYSPRPPPPPPDPDVPIPKH